MLNSNTVKPTTFEMFMQIRCWISSAIVIYNRGSLKLTSKDQPPRNKKILTVLIR